VAKELSSRSVSDDHPHNSSVVGWAVFDGATFVCYRGYRSLAEEDALRRFPEASFKEGSGLGAGELEEIIEKQSQALWVVQLFDREGYYSSVTASSIEEVKEKAEVRMSKLKTILAASVPFEGHWSSSGLRDISLPADFKEALSALDRPQEDS
jgi:hypothetical protein